MKIDRWQAAMTLALCTSVFAQSGLAAEAGRVPVLLEIDQQIRAVTTQVASLKNPNQEPQSRKKTETQCRETFLVGDLIKNYAHNSFDFGADFEQAFVVNQVCHAAQMGNAALCLSMPKAAMTSACQSFYWELMHSKILITAPADPAGAQRLCLIRETQAIGTRPLGIDPRALCDIYVRYANDAHERAEKIVLLTPPEKRAKLLSKLNELEAADRVRMGLVSPAACSQKDWMSRQLCSTARIYRAAYTKNDASLCGESGICLALMGQGANSCTVYADRLARSFCAQKASGTEVDDLQKKRNEKMAQVVAAQRTLSNLLITLDSITPRGRPGVASRREKVVGLLRQCNALIRTLVPAGAVGRHPKSPAAADEDR